MTRVNILTVHELAIPCFLRQAPKTVDEKSSVTWRSLSFVFNQTVLRDDIVVVYDYPPQHIKIEVASRRQVVHLSTEPFDRYPYDFIKQFGTVVSQKSKPADYDGTWINSHGCLEWWYGVRHQPDGKRQVVMDWDGLGYAPIKTNQRVSVIASTKDMAAVQGHAIRNKFVDALSVSDLPIDVFGRGRREIADKVEGLFHYPYTIALENTMLDDYWTEKLADALLAECFVFYAGCPNIKKYFDVLSNDNNKGSLVMLDINDAAGAIAIIKKTMADKAWEKQQVAIKSNKQKLMMEQNIYPVILNILLQQGILKAQS